MEKKCSIDGCEKDARAKGLCSMHYNRVRKGIIDMRPARLPWADDDPRYKNKGRLCDVDGCNRPFYAKGLCQTHHARQLRNGNLIYKKDLPKPKCSVNGCNELATSIKSGFCVFHYIRFKNGVPLDRPKGVKGALNHNWKGGVAMYPNHSEMKRIRKIILKEANYICYYCGKPTNQIHHKDLSRDNHSKENLVACCKSCNRKRSKPYTCKFKRLYGKSSIELAKELGVSATTITTRFKKYGNIDPRKIISHRELFPSHTSKFIRLYGKTLQELAHEMGVSTATIYRLHGQKRLLFTTESITCA